MNGIIEDMYSMRQIIVHDAKVPVSNCMYTMKSIHIPAEPQHAFCKNEPVSDTSRCTIREQVKRFLKNFDSTNDDSKKMTEIIDRQQAILRQLEDLRQQMVALKNSLSSSRCPAVPPQVRQPQSRTSSMEALVQRLKQGLIILKASPTHLPYFLLAVRALWKNHVNLRVQVHVHSSVVDLSPEAKKFTESLKTEQVNSTCNLPVLHIRLIWKDVGPNTEMLLSTKSTVPIIGEVNILRYLARLVPECLNYENLPNVHEIDEILDTCYLLSYVKTKTERAALMQTWSKILSKSTWLCGSNISVADVAVNSAIRHVSLSEVSANLNKWLQKYDSAIGIVAF